MGQYRMHPLIAEFPSDSFYRGRLKTGVSLRERMPPLGFPWPNSGTPVAFIDSTGPERIEGHSYTNQMEIKKATWVLEQLLSRGDPLLPGGPSDIGVITPYSSQSRLLKRSLRQQKHRQLGLNHIEVSTVDGFQGREKEVIIFTAVRSNEMGKVGFLDKWRRMNVMMTRPRRGLIIIGNERATGRYMPTFLGDTLVGESEDVDRSIGTSKVTEQKSINSSVPQAFLDAQKGISSETWDSTTSPVHSPTMKQWDEANAGSDDDWEALDSDSDDDNESAAQNTEVKNSSDADENKDDVEGESTGVSLAESQSSQVGNSSAGKSVLESMQGMNL